MADENGTVVEPLTDEQLGQQFPGQDVAHLRSMMNKADGATAAPAGDVNDTTYPDYIPEKFRQGTPEEAAAKMAASYAELERTVSGKPSAAPAVPADASGKESEGTATEASGISMESITAEYQANEGVIAPESYEAMAAKGLPKEMVDNYIAGQEAIANQLVTKTYALAGGEAEFTAMIEWAGQNWSESQIAAYDAVMNTNNEASIALAVSGLKTAMTTSGYTAPNLVPGEGGQAGNNGGSYQSKAEMTADMASDQYKNDSAFRAKVAAKLENSKIW